MADQIIRIDSISKLFSLFNWEKPKHPLIGVINIEDVNEADVDMEMYQGARVVSDLYLIVLKDGNCGLQYGRNKYDFDEGVLSFFAPGQISTVTSSTPSTYGFMLIFHPDLIQNFELGKTIKRYNFFSYATHEALHLSKREEDTLTGIVKNISLELDANIDKHSQELLVTNIQLLLNYSKRFYERQFITRANAGSDVISKMEELLIQYYDQGLQLTAGTPSPEYFAERINFSTNYLSDLLRRETGKTTKDHIDDYVINLAKHELLSSKNTVSEIAYNLGFNYPHYFSRMFKKKTGQAPLQFRSSTLN